MRPRDLAVLLLSSEELRPRKRLRSQHPDITGMELKRRLLEAVADVDPDPESLDAALAGLIDQLGSPPGPIRELALGFRDDWLGLASNPHWLKQLEEEGARSSGKTHGQERHR